MIRFYHTQGYRSKLFYSLAPPKDEPNIAKVHVSKWGTIGYIGSLYINPSYRNRGFATRLMKKVIKLYGNKELQLLARPHEIAENVDRIPLDKLVSFYRRFGFLETDTYVDGVEMRRPVQ